MRLLFVAPHPFSSGEATTALHAALAARADGAEIGFVASPAAARIFSGHFPGRITELGPDPAHNRRAAEEAAARLRPGAIIFCDHALLAGSTGGLPLGAEDTADGDAADWIDRLDGELYTFDHLGLEQAGAEPAARPARPARMRLLLPCPIHEPAARPRFRGTPFCAWRPRPVDPAVRAAVRRDLGLEEGGLLLVHPVAPWAWAMARARRVPLYDLLPALLELYVEQVGGPITLVSVNDGGLLPPAPAGRLRVVNRGPLPTEEFEALLAAADLVLGENRFSSALGKAICLGVPAVAWHNRFDAAGARQHLSRGAPPDLVDRILGRPEAIEPWMVFPLLSFAWADRLAVLEENRIADGFRRLELFGGRATAEELSAILVDPGAREPLLEAGRRYAAALDQLPGFCAVLAPGATA